MLGNNKFDLNDRGFLNDLINLLTVAKPLVTISLQNDTPRSSYLTDLMQVDVSPLITLLKETIAAGMQDSQTTSVTKYIFFDDNTKFPMLFEKKIPLTRCQKFGKAMKVFVPGILIFAVTGIIPTIITYYFGHDCNSGF